MLLREILRPDCVKVPLDSASKQEAIYEMVEMLCDRMGIDAKEELKQAVWQREKTRTTGIGHGVAIPHGKSLSCKQVCMAIAKPASPLDFGSIDGKPVDLIILLISPRDETGPHIQALASISRMLTDERFRAALKKAGTAQEVYDLIMQQESQVTKSL